MQVIFIKIIDSFHLTLITRRVDKENCLCKIADLSWNRKKRGVVRGIPQGVDFFHFWQSQRLIFEAALAAPKQAMFQNMADAGGFEDEEAGFAKNEKN